MTTVNSREELKAALERGETQFYVEDKQFRMALYIASKKSSKLQIAKMQTLSKAEIAAELGMEGLTVEVAAIFLAGFVAACLTAIAIVAILKGRKIEGDLRSGKFKVI